MVIPTKRAAEETEDKQVKQATVEDHGDSGNESESEDEQAFEGLMNENIPNEETQHAIVSVKPNAVPATQEEIAIYYLEKFLTSGKATFMQLLPTASVIRDSKTGKFSYKIGNRISDSLSLALPKRLQWTTKLITGSFDPTASGRKFNTFADAKYTATTLAPLSGEHPAVVKVTTFSMDHLLRLYLEFLALLYPEMKEDEILELSQQDKTNETHHFTSFVGYYKGTRFIKTKKKLSEQLETPLPEKLYAQNLAKAANKEEFEKSEKKKREKRKAQDEEWARVKVWLEKVDPNGEILQYASNTHMYRPVKAYDHRDNSKKLVFFQIPEGSLCISHEVLSFSATGGTHQMSNLDALEVISTPDQLPMPEYSRESTASHLPSFYD